MFWIKTYRGHLCNLANATDITVNMDAGEHAVRAHFPCTDPEIDPVTTLYRGAEPQCQEFLDSICSRLAGHNSMYDSSYHEIKTPKPAPPAEDIPF